MSGVIAGGISPGDSIALAHDLSLSNGDIGSISEARRIYLGVRSVPNCEAQLAKLSVSFGGINIIERRANFMMVTQ